MTRPALVLGLSPGEQPVFLRLARSLADAMQQGRLPPGSRLPGSRTLAAQLGVHRNTVLAALGELTAQGWLRGEPGRGTFVVDALPLRPSHPRATPRPWGAPAAFALPPIGPWSLRSVPSTGGAAGRGAPLLLSAGEPDPRLVPVDAIGRAWRRVLRRDGSALLSYGSPHGHPALRRALAAMVSETRGLAVSADAVLVTRGSQMALTLCARGLLAPGDRVAVEALGYAPAWDALRLAGAKLAPVPVDAQGLDVAALGRMLAGRRPPRALYLTPHHQYPTTVTLAPSRRMELLDMARRHRLLVIEDDYDHEFHYDGRPVLPLASADDGASVVYIGTLSKVLAPGLRLGFLVATGEVIERLGALRMVIDRQGDHALEAAVADWIDEGELGRHVRTMHRVYRERRDALVDLIARRLGGSLQAEAPQGGIAVWARAAPGVDLDAWGKAAAARGVVVRPGRHYTFDGSDPRALRLTFARLSVPELTRAIARLAETRPRRTGVTPIVTPA